MPALNTPDVLDNLWTQTLSAYLDNPLPALFKEKLKATLSRYCSSPYCMVCHSCSLRPLGVSTTNILALIEAPPPTTAAMNRHLALLSALPDLDLFALSSDSAEEQSLLACLSYIFLEGRQATRCQLEIQRVLGADAYNHLSALLAYIKTCHTWTEMHPEITYETDQRAQANLGAMLSEEPALADFIRSYRTRASHDREQTSAALRERAHLAALSTEVGLALIHEENLPTLLQRCAKAVVSHLDAAFARIWTVDESDNMLVLQASAGMYTHLDGPHGRLPIGQFKIGLIAQERMPHLTNEVIGDPRVSDQDWAKREGMVAFAGYPLIVEDHLVGVMAMFSRTALPDATLEALASIANGIALGIEKKQVQWELKRNEQLLRTTLSSIGDGVITTDLERRITFMNPIAEELTAWSLSEALGCSATDVFKIVNEVTRERVDSPIERAITEGIIVGLANHTILITRDGSERHIDDSGAPIRNHDGTLHGAVLVFRDISERRRAEVALIQANARTSNILESITDAFFALDSEWRFTHVNDQAERLLLRTREELLGHSIWDEFPDAVDSVFYHQYHRTASEGITANFEEFYPPLATWFEVRAYPSPDGISVYFHDINARKEAELARDQAEQALRESEQRFRQMADAIPHIAWTTGPDGSVSYYNQRWYLYSGLTLDETRDWGWEAVIHPDDLTHAGSVWRANIAAGRASEVEYRLKRADGEYRWHLGRSEPVHDHEGKIVNWVGTATDISERKAAEEAQASLLHHEHTIASQLQEALQPELPGAVPGLKVTKYYEAALAEAGVGGDFYDVFAIEKGCTAIIVGDLSGKGLAAAAQVSTVRNMLRAFLYSKPKLVEAVSELNRVLAENRLLTGFATLFVGAYDSGTATLRYVNCGQEPALVRRKADSSIQELSPTGPIMGSMEGSQYTEETVQLLSGDALAIFTDGMTEVGPSRSNMLGLEGVSALFAQSTQSEATQKCENLAQILIDGVNSYAEGGVRDDVCLLVAVVE